jgi:hypothetical protein
MRKAHPQRRTAPNSATSLLGALLGELVGQPVVGDEGRELAHGPAGLDLADDVDEVAIWVDAEQEAAVDEREDDGQALATPLRAGEEEHSARHGEQPDAALDATVINLEGTIFEASSEEGTLVDGVG